jgi:uncharacterized membrane protein YraQ (UPF0718 family)
LHPPSPRKLFDWSFWLIAALTVLSAAVVWRRDGADVFNRIFIDDVWLFVEIVPKVIAGTLIGELVRRLVPREVIVRWLGEGSGLKGLFVAGFIGFIFPAGPFTIFPLAAMLLVAGADRGATAAFITGWLVLGVNRMLIWEMPFFGGDIALMRLALSFWMPLAVGLIARALPGPDAAPHAGAGPS